MHKTAQAWFTGGPSSDLDKTSSSLLADWNAYAASSNAADEDSSSFDLEAAVRTANDKVTSTFGVVSKGVRELPGSFNSATSSVLLESLLFGSFFALKGPRSQLSHMLSKETPFHIGIYWQHGRTIYVLALSYYAISYFPGGSAGLKFLSSTLASSVLRCFGR
ncbi:hypothetical protein Sango_2501300 [Sesamum angolense]|uniref:Vesicle transport protein n=1 Tax=Sesamum angolense TaxID=2727404 RepID=A0AAE1W3X9_9LAMI|nr:hypothetical protein Sango_2501300 [Sesamum angolense]